MIPALESRLLDRSVADIGSVPAVRVSLGLGQNIISCLGLIDTGADISMLDASLTRRLSSDAQSAPVDTFRTINAAGETLELPLLSLTLSIGEQDSGELVFPEVPVAVATLNRPLLLLGRRGLLEWLKLEIDFPQNIVTLTRSQNLFKRFPALSNQVPGFDRLIESAQGERVAEGIAMIALHLERYIDLLITADPSLQPDTNWRTRASFPEKLSLVCAKRTTDDLSNDVKTVVLNRNIAVHGSAMRGDLSLSLANFLEAAERVVAGISETNAVASDSTGIHESAEDLDLKANSLLPWMQIEAAEGRYEHTLREVAGPLNISLRSAEPLLQRLVGKGRLSVRHRGRTRFTAYYSLNELRLSAIKSLGTREESGTPEAEIIVAYLESAAAEGRFEHTLNELRQAVGISRERIQRALEMMRSIEKISVRVRGANHVPYYSLKLDMSEIRRSEILFDAHEADESLTALNRWTSKSTLSRAERESIRRVIEQRNLRFVPLIGAAAIFGVSIQTFRGYLKRGIIQLAGVHKGQYVFGVEDLRHRHSQLRSLSKQSLSLPDNSKSRT